MVFSVPNTASEKVTLGNKLIYKEGRFFKYHRALECQTNIVISCMQNVFSSTEFTMALLHLDEMDEG